MMFNGRRQYQFDRKTTAFCLYFVKCFNATRAYLKAYNCSYSTAAVEGCRLLKNPKIKEMIDILKKNG